MMEELRAKFRGRFITTARARLDTARQNLEGAGNAALVRGELHSLAGEAAMLGFDEIASSARIGERAARSWRDDGNAEARSECVRTLGELSRQLEVLAAEPG
jgi:HPt (histidine-containing phosphotransfer) domain-containing protein